MKAKKIYYKRLFNLGNFQNEEIGIELEVEEGEKANDVLEKAKQFVNNLDPKNEDEKKYKESLDILRNRGAWNYNRVIEADAFVKEYEARNEEDENLPF
jgi:hypothetical protein